MSREQIETYALAGLGLAGGLMRYYVRPELTAKRAWLAIGAGVLAYEVFCPDGELLSEGFDKALEKHRLATTVGTLAITGHLLNYFPEKYDLVHQGFSALKSLTRH